jgi:HlyD family secretion protein
MNRLRHSLLILALMAGVTSAAAEEAAAPASANAAPAVTVVAVTKRVISETSVVTGTLKAREEIFVTAGVDGLKIEKLLADAGDTVAAGAVLAVLSTDTLDIQLSQNASQLARADAAVAQARAQITQAEASATQAKSALDRATALKAKGVIAQDVLDQRGRALPPRRPTRRSPRHFVAI